MSHPDSVGEMHRKVRALIRGEGSLEAQAGSRPGREQARNNVEQSTQAGRQRQWTARKGPTVLQAFIHFIGGVVT